MRIAESKLVRRFLLKFNKVETSYLRGIGFLHPECAEESEMWVTMEEFHMISEFQCFDSKVMMDMMEDAIKHINAELDKQQKVN